MKWLKRWKTQTLLLAVIGPGFITANVDAQDAHGIRAQSFARAHFGRISGCMNYSRISDHLRPELFSGMCAS
jgi:hypothetical protein